jgi:hypothetical protein
MKTFLHLPAQVHTDLLAHLLPPKQFCEEAAFVFASSEHSNGVMNFNFLDAVKLGPSDFLYQESDYLEMTDATRAALIKRAHDLNASLVELHSHLGSWPAAFSPSDHHGLQETVPHMWWRLAKRPYLAAVVTRNEFDALVWLNNPEIPQSLDELVVGKRVLRPTNNSLKDWL